jgi:nitrite reductase (NADH) small subunit
MWTRVANETEVPEGGATLVEAGGTQIALFKIGGKIYAIENGCAHRGGPLVEGHLDKAEITCPWHAWSFDVTTGACKTSADMPQKTYPVKIEGADLLIDV